MSVTLTIACVNEPDAQYDMDYYAHKHMPLVQAHRGHYGIKSWCVTQYLARPDGSPPGYAFSSSVVWRDGHSIKTALSGPETKVIMGDVANFGNKKPTILLRETVHTSGE
ncbi:hypothetical protein CEP54_014953 [Fusarium duplospermum]|uniref:EthD domain-containing protein n=1 Tax=Fusarium duplospermum TaxID=1325734 RepID=A0A428NSG3_9HYPO|nr:hypothetical protein CEP54_014953 [Fusarium duplospermum]